MESVTSATTMGAGGKQERNLWTSLQGSRRTLVVAGQETVAYNKRQEARGTQRGQRGLTMMAGTAGPVELSRLLLIPSCGCMKENQGGSQCKTEKCLNKGAGTRPL